MGNNVITGGFGNDVITTGNGNDRVLFDISRPFKRASVKTVNQAKLSNALFTYVRRTGALYYNRHNKSWGGSSDGIFNCEIQKYFNFFGFCMISLK